MRLYGPKITADHLADTKIGTSSRTVVRQRYSFPFPVVANVWRPFLVTPSGEEKQGKQGYAGGTGGKFQIDVSDDLGSLMGTASFLAEMWPVVLFPKLLNFLPGRTYRSTITNIDPRPDLNYSALNSLESTSPLILTPGVDLGTVSFSATGYPDRTRPGYTPIFSWQGPASNYSQAWIEVEPKKAKPYARQWFPAPAIDLRPLAVWTRPALKIDGELVQARDWARKPYPIGTVFPAGIPFNIPVEGWVMPIRKGTVLWKPDGKTQYPAIADPFPGGWAEFSDTGKDEEYTTFPGIPCDISIALELAG